MKRLKIVAIIIMLLMLTVSSTGAWTLDIHERPDTPEMQWHEGTSSTNQRISMTAYIPYGADRIRFYLVANDGVVARDRLNFDYEDEYVTVNFYSLREAQEAWGYIEIYDKDGNVSVPSDWTSAYIERVSNVTKDIEPPEQPEMVWENPGQSTGRNQRMTVKAQMPEGASYLEYFLVNEGKIERSGRITDESYTFRRVGFNQSVLTYVKAYTSRTSNLSRTVSYPSPVTVMFIGDDGRVSTPEMPQLQWVDLGHSQAYGQQLIMTAQKPNDAQKLHYFLYANGTLMQSHITTNTSYTFYNIQGNQMVMGFVKAYDMWDNASEESPRAQMYIPALNSAPQTPSEPETPTHPSIGQPMQPAGRISDLRRGISLREFTLPAMWVNASFHFNDVPKEDTELKQALQYFYSTHVFSDTFSENFHPNRPMTRVGFLDALVKTANLPIRQMPTILSPFEDVKADHDFHNHIVYASWQNIMRGYSDHLFRPSADLAYGTAARAIVNAYDIRLYGYEGERIIDDIGDHYVAALVNANILSHAPESQFAVMTRGEVAKTLYKIIQIQMEQ